MDHSVVKVRLRQFEGCTSFMYRCSGGEVTIGVGHAIASAILASQLQWEANGGAAGADQVTADFEKVAAAEKGHVASTYANLTACRMADEEIDRILESDVAAFEAQLAEALPNWSGLPEPAQQALFDMAFNLGMGGLGKFHNLLRAVNAGDWETAAAECHRLGIQDARNEETAALFRQAAAEGATSAASA